MTSSLVFVHISCLFTRHVLEPVETGHEPLSVLVPLPVMPQFFTLLQRFILFFYVQLIRTTQRATWRLLIWLNCIWCDLALNLFGHVKISHIKITHINYSIFLFKYISMQVCKRCLSLSGNIWHMVIEKAFAA